jgi:hypothetical protein
MSTTTHADLITRWRLATARTQEAARAEYEARDAVIKELRLDEEMDPIAIPDGAGGFYITHLQGRVGLIATHTSEMQP